MKRISARRRTSTPRPVAGWAWSGAASSWRRTGPIWGWGSGSFGAAFSRHIQRARTTVSHSEPITVAAEQGAIGLMVYVALVGLALVVLLGGAGGSAGTAAVAAGFVAMLVHSLSYAGFAIDPATWALLGLGVALRRTRPRPGGRRGRRRRPRHPSSPRPRDPPRPSGPLGVRVPAAAGHDGGRVHGLQRGLEVDRGLPAADLHALSDPERLRRRGGDARLGDRGKHRRAAGRHRGDTALLLPRRRTSGAGGLDGLRIAVLGRHGRRRDRPAVRWADLAGLARSRGRRAGPARDPRPMDADHVRVRADAAPAR